MSELRIVCAYRRDGAAIIGRCPEFDDVDEVRGIDRGQVEERLHRAVLKRLHARAEFVCFVDKATEDDATKSQQGVSEIHGEKCEPSP